MVGMTSSMVANARSPIVCVLGCRSGSAALERRVRLGAELFFARGASLVVVSGGRAWGTTGDVEVEADAMAAMLTRSGIASDAIVRERCSLDTRDNARFTAALLRRRIGAGREADDGLLLVTCSWHLPRAERAFRAVGLDVEGVGAEPPPASLFERVYRAGRERLSSWNDGRRGAGLA